MLPRADAGLAASPWSLRKDEAETGSGCGCCVALDVARCRPGQVDLFPVPGDWERKSPKEVGMDPLLLATATDFAESQETSKPMDFSDQERMSGQLLGPVPDRRAHTNGLVIRHGYIVAEFGDTAAVDPTDSAAKSYLSTLVGVAPGAESRCP